MNTPDSKPTTVGTAPFKRFGDPLELTSQVAASLAWSGKLADLAEWQRPATEAAAAACK